MVRIRYIFYTLTVKIYNIECILVQQKNKIIFKVTENINILF